jgi:hypothetical protein
MGATVFCHSRPQDDPRTARRRAERWRLYRVHLGLAQPFAIASQRGQELTQRRPSRPPWIMASSGRMRWGSDREGIGRLVADVLTAHP